MVNMPSVVPPALIWRLLGMGEEFLTAEQLAGEVGN